MSKRIVIEQGQIALMEENQLLSLLPAAAPGIVGEQIYLGQVDRIVRGMAACFVKLGGESTGFLPFSECGQPPRSGEKMLVQIKKTPIGGKDAYLTADLSLAGRYAILTPLSHHFAVSKRVEDEGERERLLHLARRLAPQGMGLVMRWESVQAEEGAIAEEIQALRDRWQEVLERRAARTAPGLILDREDALSRLLRDEHGGIQEILTDDPAAAKGRGVPVRACDHPFDLYNVTAKWQKSTGRKVWLDCGGYLVIDPTEALIAIDVNSGKFTGGRAGTENTFLQLNLEAAREIARILRLRNLGGIILIDFVDMQSEESRAAVTSALQSALQGDPVKTVIHGFTSLGLMEMTRKKADAPIAE